LPTTSTSITYYNQSILLNLTTIKPTTFMLYIVPTQTTLTQNTKIINSDANTSQSNDSANIFSNKLIIFSLIGGVVLLLLILAIIIRKKRTTNKINDKQDILNNNVANYTNPIFDKSIRMLNNSFYDNIMEVHNNNNNYFKPIIEKNQYDNVINNELNETNEFNDYEEPKVEENDEPNETNETNEFNDYEEPKVEENNELNETNEFNDYEEPKVEENNYNEIDEELDINNTNVYDHVVNDINNTNVYDHVVNDIDETNVYDSVCNNNMVTDEQSYLTIVNAENQEECIEQITYDLAQ